MTRAGLSRFPLLATLLLFTLSLSALAQTYSSAAPAGANLQQQLPARFSGAELQKLDPSLVVYPDFSDTVKVTDFVDRHPYVGFVAHGKRVLFVTRNSREAERLLKRMTSAEVLSSSPKPIRIFEIPGYVAYDVSRATIFNDRVLDLHGLYAREGGPNCWNLALLYLGWAQTVFPANSREFQLWVDGPFSVPAADITEYGFAPKPGDVIVLRQIDPITGQKYEAHGAIALGHGLVFTKNGAVQEAPYEVSTIESLIQAYLPSQSNTIEFRRIRPFNEVWAEWEPKLDPSLAQAWREWFGFEREHAKLYLPSKTVHLPAPSAEDVQRLDEMRREIKRRIVPLFVAGRQRYEGVAAPTELQRIEIFLWKLLEIRSNSSYF